MDRHDRNLAQLQLLLLEMERQLLIISAMIDQLRSRWGLPGGDGLPVGDYLGHACADSVLVPLLLLVRTFKSHQ